MQEELKRCLLCSNPRLKRDLHTAWILNLSSPHGVTVCMDCGFRFLNPRPSLSSYQELYSHGSGPLVETYDLESHHYRKADARRLGVYRNKVDVLRTIGARGRLLEIGSCTGVFLNTAKEHGFEVEGIEPSVENARIAKSLYGLDLHVGNVEDMDFPEGSFDVVFSSHVFEHLLDPLAIAKKTNHWLRIGGFHMIEVPNHFDTFGAKRRRLMRSGNQRKRDFRSIHHVSFFSPRTLRKMLELCNCRQYSMRNVYYSSIKTLQNPKEMLHRLIALFFGGMNIEIIAEKLGSSPESV